MKNVWKIRVKVSRWGWGWAIYSQYDGNPGIVYGKRTSGLAAQISKKNISGFTKKLVDTYPDIIMVSLVRVR